MSCLNNFYRFSCFYVYWIYINKHICYIHWFNCFCFDRLVGCFINNKRERMAESMKGPIHYVRGRTWPRRWSLVDQNLKKYYRQFLKVCTSTSAKKFTIIKLILTYQFNIKVGRGTRSPLKGTVT